VPEIASEGFSTRVYLGFGMLLRVYDSAHYNLNYPCSRSSFTGCCHDCGQSTFTTLNTSPQKVWEK